MRLKNATISFVGFVLLLPAIALAGKGLGQPEPLASINPILIDNELGEVATSSDKLLVSLRITIDRDQVTRNILLRDLGMLGANLSIDISTVEEIAVALEEASDSLMERRQFTRKIGNSIELTSDAVANQSVVRLRMADSRLTFSNDSITVDADNAMLLSRLIRRGERINEWFTPHIDSMKN